MGAREGGSRGRECTGRSFRYARLLGADRGIAARELPRVSARSDAAHRDARALPFAPTHPATRPDAYLDVPSRWEPAAGARWRASLAPRICLCSLRPPGGFHERYEGAKGTGNAGGGWSCASRAATATRRDVDGRSRLTYIDVGCRARRRGKPAKAAECALCCCRRGERRQLRR